MSLNRQLTVPNREALLRALGIDPAVLDLVQAAQSNRSSLFQPTRTLSVDEAIRQFLAWLEGGKEDQASSATMTTYSGVLQHFKEFLETRWAGLPRESWTVQKITVVDVEEFVRRPKRDGGVRSAFTMNRDISIISSMMRWLRKRQLVGENPVQGMERPREPKLLPVALSAAEQELLLDRSRQTASGLRNHTIIHLVLNTGLRAQEVSDLRWSSIELTEGWMKVHGKGKKERTLPLRPIVVDSLQYYWTACRSKQLVAPGCEDAVFVNEKGSRLGHPMSVDALERMLRPLMRGLGKPRGNMHVLRHTFALNLLRRGVHIVIINHLLGHELFETTRDYLRMGDPELASELAQSFPEGVLVPSTMRDLSDEGLKEVINRVYKG